MNKILTVLVVATLTHLTQEVRSDSTSETRGSGSKSLVLQETSKLQLHLRKTNMTYNLKRAGRRSELVRQRRRWRERKRTDPLSGEGR